MRKSLLLLALAIIAITATSCKKDEKNKVNSITFQQEVIYARPSSTHTISVLVDPAGSELVWSSDNTAIATVDNGNVTAISDGTAIITAASKDGSVSASLKVIVDSKVTGRFIVNKNFLNYVDFVVKQQLPGYDASEQYEVNINDCIALEQKYKDEFCRLIAVATDNEEQARQLAEDLVYFPMEAQFKGTGVMNMDFVSAHRNGTPSPEGNLISLACCFGVQNFDQVSFGAMHAYADIIDDELFNDFLNVITTESSEHFTIEY